MTIKYPIKEVRVIDPATGDIFSFYDVENEQQIKNIQRLRYEILEKIY